MAKNYRMWGGSLEKNYFPQFPTKPSGPENFFCPKRWIYAKLKFCWKLVLSMFFCSLSRKIYHWKAKFCWDRNELRERRWKHISIDFPLVRCCIRESLIARSVVSTSEHETVFFLFSSSSFCYSTRNIFKQLLIYFGGRRGAGQGERVMKKFLC